MSTYNEPARALEFLMSEANGTISRENVTLSASLGALDAGTVMGRKLSGGSATATATTGNSGNGTMGTITVSAAAKIGNYNLVVVEPGSDAGAFIVTDPDGEIVKKGAVASAFSAGGLAFTLADGAMDFAAGDSFTIAVTGAYRYEDYDNTATDGTQVAVAILAYPAPASDATQSATVIVRHAEVKEDFLDWGANDADGITAGTADLAKVGILVRAG